MRFMLSGTLHTKLPPRSALASGRHRAPHLWDPGATRPLPASHQHLCHPQGAAEGAAAKAQHHHPRAAQRHEDHGNNGPRCRYPQPGDDLLVLHGRAARRLRQAPHRHGKRQEER